MDNILIIYKILTLFIGLAFAYMGYKLFEKGIFKESGSAEGTFGNNKILIKKAAPGTFFVIFGAIIIGISVYKGISVDYSNQRVGNNIQKSKIDNEILLRKLEHDINLNRAKYNEFTSSIESAKISLKLQMSDDKNEDDDAIKFLEKEKGMIVKKLEDLEIKRNEILNN